MDRQYDFNDLVKTVETLLGENGCPWDRKQTHESLRQSLIEECYEAVEAINNRDNPLLLEELGDILLVVLLNTKIAEKEGEFTLNDITDAITRKIIRRHSHVFGSVSVTDADGSLKNWEAEKQIEKGYGSQAEKLKSVPNTLPALMRAAKVLGRAASSGLDGYIRKDSDTLISTTADSLKAFKSADFEEKEDLERYFGRILMDIVNISGLFEINAEFALTNAIETFINVFENVENASKSNDNGLSPGR